MSITKLLYIGQLLPALAASFRPGTYSYQDLEIIGNPLSAITDEATKDLISLYNHHPTASRSVIWKPFESYWDQIPENSVVRNSAWTWRVNISDVNATNAQTSIDIPEPHVISTVYDFSWDTSGNLSKALGGDNGTFCLTIQGDIDMPVNVTNLYSDENGNSTSCVPILGQECVDAILADDDGLSSSGQYCKGPRTSWYRLKECQATLGFAASIKGGPSYITASFGHNGSDADNSTSGWKSDQGFFGTLTSVTNGSLGLPYLSATNQLRIISINTQLSTNNGFTGGPDLLCMRVNATRLGNNDENNDDIATVEENIFSARMSGAALWNAGYGCVSVVSAAIILSLLS